MWITFVDRKLFTLCFFGGKQLYTEKNGKKSGKTEELKWGKRKLSTNYQQIVDNF